MKKIIIILSLFISYSSYAQYVPKAGNKLNVKPNGILVPTSTTDDTPIARIELLPLGSSLLKPSALPIATNSLLGAIKIGSGLSIDGSGVLSTAGGGGGTPANPTALVGVTPVNGIATTYMRSDAAPAVDTTLIRTVANSRTLAQTQTALNAKQNTLTYANNSELINTSHVAFWGDSFTWGQNARDATFVTSYAVLSGLIPYNGGVPGETSTQIRARQVAANINGWNTVFEEGRNDVTASVPNSTIEANIAAQVALLGHTRYLVLGILKVNNETTGTSRAITINALNADLLAAYGTRFLDLQAMLNSNGDGSAQDNTDIANGVTPSSLRSDVIHLNAKGNALVAAFIHTKTASIFSAAQSTNAVNASNAPAFNANILSQYNIARGGFYSIGGQPVVSLPNQSLLPGNLYIGEGGYFTTGTNNTFVGQGNGVANTTGGNNFYGGSFSGFNATTGSTNTYLGAYSGYGQTDGGQNVMVGYNSGGNGNSAGASFFGQGAGKNATGGFANISIGRNTHLANTGGNFQLTIGNLIYGTNLDAEGDAISSGNIGIGVKAPGARLDLAAGTATAGTAPLKLNSGTNTTTAVSGQLEYNGTSLFFTPTGTTRQTIAYLGLAQTYTAQQSGTTPTAKDNTTKFATTAYVGKQFTATGSGTGSATTITVAHGISGVTSANSVIVFPNNAAAAGISYATMDATNVSIVYTVAPANGTNNLAYSISIK